MTIQQLIATTGFLALTASLAVGQANSTPTSNSPTTRSVTAVQGLETTDILDAFLRREMSQRRIPGMQVAVVKGGQLVLLKSYGIANLQDSTPVTNRSIFSINSCTKAFTGVAIMQLVEAGKVELTAPLSRYLDGLPIAWQPITIRQLLTHISGLPDILRVLSTGETNEETAWAKVQTLPMDFPTGEQFSYNQTNYVLLGKVIDKFNGKPFTEVFRERQFRVAGMPSTGFGDSRDVIPGKAPSYRYVTNMDGQSFSNPKLTTVYEEFPPFRRTASGMNSTAEDLAHWIIALQRGNLLRTRAALDTMWTAGRYNNGLPTQWALGWGLTKFRPEHRAVGMTGGGRSAFLAYPDDDLAIVVLTNLSGSFPEDFMEELAGYFNPAIPLSDPITNLRMQLQKRGFGQAITVVTEMRKRNSILRPTETDLNDWAYRLMSKGQKREAFELFKLNVSLYPDSWNVYDSLAEVYGQMGNRQLAIENYKRSLALNPGNTNASTALKQFTQSGKN
ncbi:MAG: class A beta-lactamase-related serine hydrolase [Bacteroidetes bacterium]|nr:class A beta-lactamase-related serine hydrolase [Fibrella sp.]